MTATGLRPGSRTRKDPARAARTPGRSSGPDGRGTGRAAMHARFAQRARALRRRARRLWIWLIVVLVLVSAVVVTLWWSPAFVVSEVNVSGVEGDVATDTVQRASVPLGIPLARVDTDVVAGRVQEDLRVAEADVSRDWPSAVDIDIVLREPVLVIDQRGSAGLQAADASGVIFDDVAEPSADLMLVRASRGDLSADSLTGVLSLMAALPPETERQIHSVRLRADGDLSFALGSVQVGWGRPGQEALKAEVLDALLAQEQIDPESDHDITVDLSTPQTPVVTGLVPDEDR